MSSPESTWARLAREPLVHFALLGAAIFAAHSLSREPVPPRGEDERVIRLDERYLDALVQRETVAGARDDREAVARRWIREEALAREARRLGLDAHDPILRRRLVQKMELWLEAHVELEEPDEGALREALTAHPGRYRREGRISFEHAYFSSERTDPAADATAARSRIEAGAPPADLGDPFLLGRRLADRTTTEIEQRFGLAFARALAEAPLDTWIGPVESAYGAHLVRVTERREGGLPPLEDVRERVRRDVLRERREAAVRQAERELLERYRVIRDAR